MRTTACEASDKVGRGEALKFMMSATMVVVRLTNRERARKKKRVIKVMHSSQCEKDGECSSVVPFIHRSLEHCRSVFFSSQLNWQEWEEASQESRVAVCQ